MGDPRRQQCGSQSDISAKEEGDNEAIIPAIDSFESQLKPYVLPHWLRHHQLSKAERVKIYMELGCNCQCRARARDGNQKTLRVGGPCDKTKAAFQMAMEMLKSKGPNAYASESSDNSDSAPPPKRNIKGGYGKRYNGAEQYHNGYHNNNFWNGTAPQHVATQPSAHPIWWPQHVPAPAPMMQYYMQGQSMPYYWPHPAASAEHAYAYAHGYHGAAELAYVHSSQQSQWLPEKSTAPPAYVHCSQQTQWPPEKSTAPPQKIEKMQATEQIEKECHPTGSNAEKMEKECNAEKIEKTAPQDELLLKTKKTQNRISF